MGQSSISVSQSLLGPHEGVPGVFPGRNWVAQGVEVTVVTQDGGSAES